MFAEAEESQDIKTRSTTVYTYMSVYFNHTKRGGGGGGGLELRVFWFARDMLVFVYLRGCHIECQRGVFVFIT